VSRNAKLHFTIGLITLLAAALVFFVDYVSYYEIKYGRNLVFKGMSKYLLAASLVFASAGFLLTAKKRSAKYVSLDESSANMVAFLVAMILAILAYVSEAGVFGEH